MGSDEELEDASFVCLDSHRLTQIWKDRLRQRLLRDYNDLSETYTNGTDKFRLLFNDTRFSLHQTNLLYPQKITDWIPLENQLP